MVVVFMNEKLKFTVGGVEVFLSREDVEQRLRTVEPENIREVSVEVNGKRYPVKQALADATGLLRGNFTSHCFAGICYRSKANVESLLSLKGVKDVQAITMLARSLFELAVDIKLIGIIPDGLQGHPPHSLRKFERSRGVH